MRTILFAGTLILSSLSPAVCQDFTAEQRAACKGDYEKYCKGTVPGGGRVLACLNKQYAQLTEACKKVVELAEKVARSCAFRFYREPPVVRRLPGSSAVSLSHRRRVTHLCDLPACLPHWQAAQCSAIAARSRVGPRRDP